MQYILGALIGLIAGYFLGAYAARKMAQSNLEDRNRRLAESQSEITERDARLRDAADQRAALEAQVARVTAQRESDEEKIGLLNDSRAKLEETFKALAGDALKTNSESFSALARSQVATLIQQSEGNQEKRRAEIEKLVIPLSDALKRYQDNLEAMKKSQHEGNAGLHEQVLSLMQAQDSWRRQTENLVNALRMPQTRGRWGELTLHRAAELAGMAEHCDFSEQLSRNSEEGRLRPDMVIHLPGGREIVVDSKVSLEAYLKAVEAPSEDEKRAKMAEHAAQVRRHMEQLASKEYGKQFPRAPEFTVLFLPGECFFGAAAENDPALIEDGMSRGIVIATPMTLVALLRAVAHGWRQSQVEENARRISETGKLVYDRIGVVMRHLADVGGQLRKTVDSYNKAMASITSRMVPAAQRLKELGATSAQDVEAIESVDLNPVLPEIPADSQSECNETEDA